ncbi:MAG: PfkB family carbohydrate kinase [bacterium]
MKLLVIGHSVIDKIVAGENIIIKPGGVFYSALGLSLLKKASDDFYLLTAVNPVDIQIFSNIFKNFDTHYSPTIQATPAVRLIIPDNSEREEVYENFAGPLPIFQVEDINSFDGILLNMITGFDVQISELKTFATDYRGLIYFDVHTLSRGVDENNRRVFRKIPDATQWLDCVDIVQANNYELLTLSGIENEFESAKFILSRRPHILIITMGETGAKIFYCENGEIKNKFITAEKVNAVNKIGCGDIFGSVFFYSYISTQDIHESLRRANIAASYITLVNNPEDFLLFKNDIIERFNKK